MRKKHKCNVFLFYLVLIFFLSSITVVYAGNIRDLKSSGSLIKNSISGNLKPDINFGKIPLYFIENRGQANKKALYYVKTKGYTLWATKTGIVFDSIKKEKIEKKGLKTIGRDNPDKNVKSERDVQELSFLGANLNSQIFGKDKTDYKVNYFKGKENSKWKRDISTYSSIIYKNLYKGIDLKVYGKESLIEYDWIISPGADPERIVFEYNGVTTCIDKEGNIVIKGKFGNIIHKKPVSVQDGNKIEVNFKKLGKNRYGFEVGKYNKKKPLIIDPIVLVFSTYLGGSNTEYDYGIVIDSLNNIYITGFTSSLNFPTLNSYQNSNKGNYDVFITKLSNTGNYLIYSTYLGGDDSDIGYGIAIDSSNNVYVTGYTTSSNFPINNPYQGAKSEYEDAFIAKLSSTGNSLIYSTYLGGNSYDEAFRIIIDSLNNVYVTGFTVSSNFPTHNAYQGTNAGGMDIFITKLSSTGNSLVFSTYFGGNDSDAGYGIAIDSSNNVYIAGYTNSLDFPTHNPYQDTNGGDMDIAFLKFSSTGDSLIYSTYLGGDYIDVPVDIFINSSNEAYITGITESHNFPTRNAFQGTHAGGQYDTFITKFSGTGDSLIFSTYLGGNNSDYGTGIVLDFNNNIYITGFTYSTDFPVYNAYQQTNSGINDAFVTKFSSSGSSIIFSSYLGGNSSDYGNRIVLDSSNNLYITGTTKSTDFPTKHPYQASNAGNQDSFITKLGMGYTVTASISNGEGSVYPKTQNILHNSNAYINIIPDPKYEIGTIIDNGISAIIANPYVIRNIQEDHNVVVAFKHILYPPTLSLTGVRKTERAWIIRKDYSELSISIVENEYPIPVSRYILYKQVNGSWVKLTEYGSSGNYNYTDKYFKKDEKVNYKLVAVSPTGSTVAETSLSL